MAPLEPFRFELAFGGLCMFVLDPQGATIILPNASNPKRFESDPDLDTLDAEDLPRPHVPRLSYNMSQQIRDGVDPRLPDRVFIGASGDEIGVCDLEGEDLVVELPGADSFKAGSVSQVPSLSSILPVRLSDLCSAPIPNFAVCTRIRLSNGVLETLRVGYAGLRPLEVDLRNISTRGTPSGKTAVTIAEQLVLRADNLKEPVKIRSSSRSAVMLRTDFDGSGTRFRSVSASISNYHDRFYTANEVGFDFLWFYELLEFTNAGPRPSRRDLPIPVSVNGSGGFTGSSGVCPPAKL